jgi:hypothetical protein
MVLATPLHRKGTAMKQENREVEEVILGVDTHLDVHVGVVIDAVGRVKGTLSIETNPNGYQQLLTCNSLRVSSLDQSGWRPRQR